MWYDLGVAPGGLQKGETVKLINLTPHAITIIHETGTIVLPPSGQVARVATKRVSLEPVEVDGILIPVHANTYGEVEGLPDPADGVGYVVSGQVLARVATRDDVFAPDTSPAGAVRNGEGQIIGVRGLVQ